jgi:hypothetical protein
VITYYTATETPSELEKCEDKQRKFTRLILAATCCKADVYRQISEMVCSSRISFILLSFCLSSFPVLPQFEVAHSRSLTANMSPSDQQTQFDAGSIDSLEDMFVFTQGSGPASSLVSRSRNETCSKAANRPHGIDASTQTFSAFSQEEIDKSPDLAGWKYVRSCDKDLLQALVKSAEKQAAVDGQQSWREPLHLIQEPRDPSKADSIKMNAYKALSDYLNLKPASSSDGHILTMRGTPWSMLITWHNDFWHRTSFSTLVLLLWLEQYDSRKRSV